MPGPRVLLALPLPFLLALGIAGCGGGGGGDESSGGSPSKAELKEGRALFVDSCGSCHTLADAGTTGTIGPNLDAHQPGEGQVRTMIEQGGGAMPADLLTGEKADLVAAYVAEVAGD